MRIALTIFVLLLAGYCIAEPQPQMKQENLKVADDCPDAETASRSTVDGERPKNTPSPDKVVGCVTIQPCTSLDCMKRQAEKDWSEACVASRTARYGNFTTYNTARIVEACNKAARRANS